MFSRYTNFRDYLVRHFDFVAICFLLLVSAVLFFPLINIPGISSDACSFVRESADGAMPWMAWDSHRPFRTTTWNFLCLIAGYSTVGLHALAASLHLLCSLLLYVTVVLVWPKQRFFAFAAAILRLTWTTALREGVDDLILEGLLPEMLMWVAIVLWLALESWSPNRNYRIPLRILYGVTIFLSMGMYEAGWSNLGAIPLIIALLGKVDIRNRHTLVNLVCWYGTMILYVLFYFLHFSHHGKPPNSQIDFGLIAPIWLTFTRVLFVESWTVAFDMWGGLLKEGWHWIIPIIVGAAFFVVAFLASRTDSLKESEKCHWGKYLTVAIVWAFASYLHIALGLSNVYGNVVEWGSRLVLPMSYSMTFLAVVIIGFVGSKLKHRKWAWMICATMALTIINAGVIVRAWKTLPELYSHQETIHQLIAKAVPSLNPGTVIVFEAEGFMYHKSNPREFEDIMFSYLLRNEYGVRDLYVFFNSKEHPVVMEGDVLKADVSLAYPIEEEKRDGTAGIGANERYFLCRTWKDLGSPEPTKEVEIERSAVIWLRYLGDRFEVIKEKSNLNRIGSEMDPVHAKILRMATSE